MGQGEYQKRLCCGFSFFLGVDAAPAQQEQQHLPDWETKPGSRSKSWAEQKFWHSPSGMVEVLPGCVVILLLLPHQQGGLQKSLQSVCTCHYSTHYLHPKPASSGLSSTDPAAASLFSYAEAITLLELKIDFSIRCNKCKTKHCLQQIFMGCGTAIRFICRR